MGETVTPGGNACKPKPLDEMRRTREGSGASGHQEGCSTGALRMCAPLVHRSPGPAIPDNECPRLRGMRGLQIGSTCWGGAEIASNSHATEVFTRSCVWKCIVFGK